MRSKSILLFITLLFASTAATRRANAQDSLLVSLPQGGFISFVNRSEWIDLQQAIRCGARLAEAVQTHKSQN